MHRLKMISTVSSSSLTSFSRIQSNFKLNPKEIVLRTTRERRGISISRTNNESNEKEWKKSNELKKKEKEYKICVVGSGPAGFYTAESLVKMSKERKARPPLASSSPLSPLHSIPSVNSIQSQGYPDSPQKHREDSKIELKVDILEKLPSPFGLVRFGVAPDHPEVKLVSHKFEELIGDQCKFFGNITIGKDVTIEELRKHYHAIVLAYGAASDRWLNIPGEKSKGVHSARDFVG
eukprot:TRINITY_DN4850_c0_g1_i1.p1 TRINITY_DN4850_c0_g1~~TRINITY_DN4850_c0_g1_i1.p1  ORF type:complete len:235 (-),score=95.88 TRINITY_DN4850_c0_g1_i1:56-760(-)